MGLFSKKEKNTVADNIVLSPIDGEVKDLKSLNDGVFSEGMLGKGVVVAAASSAKSIIFASPVNGELVTVFPTGHAYGIKTNAGFEVLMHIGIDTVNLEGKGFKSLVKQGQKVSVGTPLVEVNLEFVRKNVPTADAIIVVTSMEEIEHKAKLGEISKGQELFEVK